MGQRSDRRGRTSVKIRVLRIARVPKGGAESPFCIGLGAVVFLLNTSKGVALHIFKNFFNSYVKVATGLLLTLFVFGGCITLWDMHQSSQKEERKKALDTKIYEFAQLGGASLAACINIGLNNYEKCRTFAASGKAQFPPEIAAEKAIRAADTESKTILHICKEFYSADVCMAKVNRAFDLVNAQHGWQ